MPQRLKVLMSAYACEPGKGSEPEVGWQWALQMARFHDVVVLTRENNRKSIERELERLHGQQALPTFAYHDRGHWFLDFKRQSKAVRWYYLLWQRSARDVIAELHRTHRFDLMHHVTFAGFRYPTAIWGHGVPTVWGPVGGIESVPPGLLPWFHPKSLLAEIGRDTHNLVQAAPFHILPRRAAATTTVLASTPEMQRAFKRLGFETPLMPTIGLDTRTVQPHARVAHDGPLRLLFVGNIITLKGVDLALNALHQSRTTATFTLIGDGNYLPVARRLAKQFGLENRVCFPGRKTRQEVLDSYSNFDVFLFPSLHDTGGYAVIEAMCCELPVICLDCGGPSVSVRDNCGVKIPTGPRTQVIAQLADAIKHYDQNRNLVRERGQAAREVILQNYDWEKKGEQMDKVYREAAATRPTQTRSTNTGTSYSGLGRTTQLLHTMISYKGLVATMLCLMLIGTLGFLSLTWLKREANRIVMDTLPGLAYSGAANAYLADASRTLLCAVTEDPARRRQIRKEIETLSKRTTMNLALYQKYIFDPEDKAIFDKLTRARKEYMIVRDQVLALADTGKHQEALAMYNQSLVPVHSNVKQAGDRLLEYNIHMGELQSKRIMTICTVTQMIVAAAVIIIFMVGFMFGLSR